MKIKDQVTSLDISIRLKELGVKQDSNFWWVDFGGKMFLWDTAEKERHLVMRIVQPCYSAFTAAEVGEMLPKWVEISKRWEELPKYKEFWLVRILKEIYTKDYPDWGNFHILSDYSLANAMGKMLIYLLENKLMWEGIS